MKEKKYTIQVEEFTIEVTQKKMKNIYLRVKRGEAGTVTVSAPHQVTKHQITDFVLQRVDWIRRQQGIQQDENHLSPQMKSYTLLPESEWYYKKKLKGQASKMILKWESKIGVHTHGLTIRKMKTRWGSCNTRTGHINLNLELAFRTEEELEYVIIHELCHLLEASHNEKFWKQVERYCPDWKRIRKEMRS